MIGASKLVHYMIGAILWHGHRVAKAAFGMNDLLKPYIRFFHLHLHPLMCRMPTRYFGLDVAARQAKKAKNGHRSAQLESFQYMSGLAIGRGTSKFSLALWGIPGGISGACAA
jgi:hypothetical protein